jgi:anti-sigma factor RsiW
MKHATEIELIELAAGRLPAEHQADLAAHLAACPECARRRDEILATWDALGDWQVEPGRDLAPDVLAAARAPGWRKRARPVLRIAASVLIAIGVGHAAGRWAWPALEGQPSPRPAAAEEQAAAQGLSLGVLEQVTATGIPEALLGAEESTDEEAS